MLDVVLRHKGYTTLNASTVEDGVTGKIWQALLTFIIDEHAHYSWTAVLYLDG